MKKAVVFMLIAVFCVMLCACANVASPENVTDDPDNTVSSEGGQDRESSRIASSAAEITAHYSALYDAPYVYRDMFNPLKYVLCGDRNIVELLAIEGLAQTKVIQKEDVERIENKETAGFCEIRIYDKTNQSISLILEPAKADELIKRVDG